MDNAGNKYLAMGYRQMTGAGTGIQYQPEVSGDKLNWYSDNTSVLGVSTTSLNSQFNWVVVQDATPITPANPRFIRLTVIQN